MKMDLKKLLKEAGLSIPAIRRIHTERDGLEIERNRLLKEKDGLLELLDKANQKIGDMDQYKTIRFSEGLSNKLQSTNNQTQYTIIGSAGRTATQWINDALNLHDDVFFVHGHNLHPTKEMVTDRESVFVRMATEDSKFDFDDVDGFFDIIERHKGCKVYGQIHGLSPAYISKHSWEFRRKYTTLCIFRHPVRRINSFIARLTYEVSQFDFRKAEFIDEYRENKNDLINSIMGKYGLSELFEEDILFVKSVSNVFDQDRINIDSDIPVYIAERLTADLDYFIDFFLCVTTYSIKIDESYLSRLQKLSPVDQRFKQSSLASDDFFKWKDWWKKYFKDEIERLELVRSYKQMGYDLSFLYAPQLFQDN